MRQANGQRVLTFRGRSAVKRRGQYLPRFGERFSYVASASWWLSIWWCSGRGVRILAVVSAVPPHNLVSSVWDTTEKSMAIRKRTVLGDPAIIPALDPTSRNLKGLPMLMEFVTVTQYDDGTPRQTGYFTLRNRFVEWEVTVYDPDAGSRLSVRSRNLDQLFLGLETLLGSPEAPWEPDRYLQSLLIPKKKKKG